MTASREKAEERSVARIRWAATAGLIGTLLLGPRGAMAQDWHDLSPRQRYDAMQNYWNYERQSDPQKRQLDQKYERFQALPQADQERVRKNYERWQKLPQAERKRFERKYEKWRRQRDAPQ